MGERTFSRKKLYQEVWVVPFTKLTEKYGITYHRLSKVCSLLNIPTPKSGYWSKVKYNKKVSIPSLPEHDIDTYTLGYTSKKDLISKLPKPTKAMTVSKQLRNLHPLVKKTYDGLKPGITDRYNRIRPQGMGTLDIAVSKENIRRSLLILNTLIKEMERQGFRVHVGKVRNTEKTIIESEGEEVYLQVRENGTRKERELKPEEKDRSWIYNRWIYTPTGELKIGLCKDYWDSPARVLSDTKTQKVEDRLDEFFPKLLALIEKLKVERKEREEWRRQIEQEWEEQKERERIKALEMSRREELEKQAELYTKCKYIDQLIQDVQNAMESSNFNTGQRKKVEEWVEWANQHADRINPLKEILHNLKNIQAE